MKKITFLIAVAMVGGLMAGSQVDIKSAIFVKIEKNVSKSFALKMQKMAKAKGNALILNPKFSCLNANFSKKDLYAKGVMYGKNRADGSLEVSGVGDFKAYSYKRYIKGNRECKETAYTKEYDPKRFGKYSYAVIVDR